MENLEDEVTHDAEVFDDSPESLSMRVVMNQLEVLGNMSGMDFLDREEKESLFDDWTELKIKVIDKAMKIILREQNKLLKY